ncbi:radical SAM protein [Desulfolucanica intricata]|uniref:radical SAM protein n=1 Tax=Desulfolucanica intricata TaxID=1285191 RepID=UPI0008342484|nr:radical SAM protein [Desulfolucanica intricata]
MKVNEIFYSLQGEGITAGYPTTFIRLTGCNLRCTYCDTGYAYEAGQEMDISEIIKKTEEIGSHYICITGGEPLLQKSELEILLPGLKKNTVTIETNGSISLKNLDYKHCRFAMDIKTPGSGMHRMMDFSNLNLLNQKDEVKFIIGSREDYEFSLNIIKEYNILDRVIITFSPVFNKLNPRLLAQWVLDDKLHKARVQLQLHKYIWDPNARGV